MAESANVSMIAERLSQQLFAEFHWQMTGPMNVNWSCEKPEEHDVKTHPADVVFYYDEPYENIRTYIHCDLKSYGNTSINKGSLKKALVSLAKQVACAEVSADWQHLYQHENHNSRVRGLLFIYNHDREYNGDFDQLVYARDPEKIPIPPSGRIFILCPGDIIWLESVRFEILSMRSLETDFRLPPRRQCRYFYPQLSRRRNVRPDTAVAATMEMLTSPWIVMEYDPDNGKHSKGIVIFYKRDSIGTDEFKYVLDYLRTYQLLDRSTVVQIKVLHTNKNAPGFFQKAKTEYLEELAGSEDSELAEIVGNVRLSMMTHVVSQYSPIEIGLDYERK